MKKTLACFSLDKEKDILVTVYRKADGTAEYALTTPNHSTGNLIANLAVLCGLSLDEDDHGMKILRGPVPAYFDGHGTRYYRFRLGPRDVARIEQDGTVTLYVSIPAIAKTLMSQTTHYTLTLAQTLVATAIPEACKFHSDLHTHMNATLTPDELIALGIVHQIRYPLYYVRKLHLRLRPEQEQVLRLQRAVVEEQFADSPLQGKYRDRRINDNTFINFADLILNNLENAAFNIPRIRASLAVMKDGQAVFTNLEKVYLYRYVFAKGIPSQKTIPLHSLEDIPDPDIVRIILQMKADHKTRAYRNNTVFQDKLLWTARNYQACGVSYAEMSDTTLVKEKESVEMLRQVHAVMPAIYAETHVRIRFLAALRRVPLTIVKDQNTPDDYMQKSLQVLRAVSVDPYVAGSDIIGEEINDIRDLKDVIGELTAIARRDPYFVLRIHAGENDSMHDNVGASVRCVRAALAPGQAMPHVRIGHGLYTPSLNSRKGKQLLQDLHDGAVTVEFQITSNVRLNNLSSLQRHPIKKYLEAGIACVQGTDGGAIYGTDSIDEQQALFTLLNLSLAEQQAMCRAEKKAMTFGEEGFQAKTAAFRQARGHRSLTSFFTKRIADSMNEPSLIITSRPMLDGRAALQDCIRPLPYDKKAIVICGGSFNNDQNDVRVKEKGKKVLDRLLAQADPKMVFFVIGDRLNGYEKYLLDHNQGRFEVYAFVPRVLSSGQVHRLRTCGAAIRVGTESSRMGLYKSVVYEIFKHRSSILVAFCGHAAGENLIQEANNAKYETRIFVDRSDRVLRAKAQSLQGYVTLFEDESIVPEILKYTIPH